MPPANDDPHADSAAAGAGPAADAAGGEAGAAEESELDQLTRELGRAKDQLLRTAADFDNFRKRSRREVVEAVGRGKEQLLKDLLPVFDNLERAIAHGGEGVSLETFLEGIRMVIKQFQDNLGRAGIERVASVGQPFDPGLHEAIQHLETSEYPPGTVAAEVQGGYRLEGRLIRAAMVVVAKPASPSEPGAGEA